MTDLRIPFVQDANIQKDLQVGQNHDRKLKQINEIQEKKLKNKHKDHYKIR